jgi:hypothetical protein
MGHHNSFVIPFIEKCQGLNEGREQVREHTTFRGMATIAAASNTGNP